MKSQVLFLVCVSFFLSSESYAFGRRRFYSQPQQYVQQPAPVQQPESLKPIPETKPQDEKLNEVEKQLLDKLNAQRASRGLPPFVVDPAIQQRARDHCLWMANMRCLRHSSGLAENIACGQTNADEAVGCWMRSSGHFANIMNLFHRRTGVAAYQSPINRQIYWCQQFSP